ncbi:unnamed protein product [Acanthoscelides obtectus]|uniref:Spaetzle domain-containing protein n=1 Tax=Acanthoscelides obtectus TaxID=200917 RepID=A0A9P0MJG5_ACAOB|nr:unnamed protein product [Acanthoscelides obtectus]CAK1656896.1 hypothetical protein AOBTE_LOCUS20004 [Acanthoscelides obtectus]
MGQNVFGAPYPFELIKNMTLRYLSRTLPILKADETLPKVAQLQQDELISQNTIANSNDRYSRVKRSDQATSSESQSNSTQVSSEDLKNVTDRQPKKFCDNGGVLCLIYKAINGEPVVPTSKNSAQMPLERRDEAPSTQLRYEGPPTPCPAKVEYATPVFAKNYQGVWRYVVQIPYEGYFTQTVEVTRCLQAKLSLFRRRFVLSSPRWSSLWSPKSSIQTQFLLVVMQPITKKFSCCFSTSVGTRFSELPTVPSEASGSPPHSMDQTTTKKPPQCDGVDALGCFQVRLYYDWFLIPGSCKCWRPDYFNKYVRRKNGNPDL